MKVSELISHLSKFDKNLDVCIFDYNSNLFIAGVDENMLNKATYTKDGEVVHAVESSDEYKFLFIGTL